VQTSRCFLDPSGPSVPTVYQGSATPTAGPTTAPKVNGTPVTLQDGLRYVDIKGGSGPVAKSGSMVTVNYTGWLVSTCQKFDRSYDSHPDQSGQSQPPQPFSVQPGKGMVLKGWEEGLIGIKAGGLRRLFIPSALAYGDQGAGPLPPNADLIFDVQMVSVK
jgi:FKBP-type peptidyl-prolyl cis-trans isomerase